MPFSIKIQIFWNYYHTSTYLHMNLSLHVAVGFLEIKVGAITLKVIRDCLIKRDFYFYSTKICNTIYIICNNVK